MKHALPGPTVEERLHPDERHEITANIALAADDARDAEAANPLFCPSCATLGQRVLLSGTHFRRNGVTTSEFACSCGWNKVVEYHTR